MPRFILFVQSGYDHDPSVREKVGKLNKDMTEAGVLVTGEGINPPSVDAYQFTYTDGTATNVVKGPFPEGSGASGVTGYWIIKTKTAEEAVEWCKKVPFPSGKVEMRKLMGDDCE